MRSRIPERINLGTTHETCLTYLFFHYKEFKESEDKDWLAKADRYACGHPIPSFQRELCWTTKQKVAFIESAFLGLPLGSWTVHKIEFSTDGASNQFSGMVIDGQQRLTTIQEYFDDEFSVFGLLFSQLNRLEKRNLIDTKFPYFEVSLASERELIDLYNRLALGGTPHKESERAL